MRQPGPAESPGAVFALPSGYSEGSFKEETMKKTPQPSQDRIAAARDNDLAAARGGDHVENPSNTPMKDGGS